MGSSCSTIKLHPRKRLPEGCFGDTLPHVGVGWGEGWGRGVGSGGGVAARGWSRGSPNVWVCRPRGVGEGASWSALSFVVRRGTFSLPGLFRCSSWGRSGWGRGGCSGVPGARGCGMPCPCPRGTGPAGRSSGRLGSFRASLRQGHPDRNRQRARARRPVRAVDGAAVEHRRAPRPVLPGVREPPVSAYRPGGRAAGPDTAGGAGGGRRLHPASRGVRAGLDVRGHHAAGRRGVAAGGEVQPGAARAADAFDGRVHRPGLLRARDAGAVERGDAAHQALAGDEDRAAVPVPADDAGGVPVRIAAVRLALPGAARADALQVVHELPPHPGVNRQVWTEALKGADAHP
ncbi:hypothetical protein SCOCK_60201 [Actinacidiphila cocklensis]|uniref:Uncharacterized protein n=1 Tax=Actinacidiphila cocklensis TaxID=887465 RepID=A0A9W4DXU6_9ACTN|nr:hypothetical protein SCOCK_60201 [Actinacidiphila cocklensis]